VVKLVGHSLSLCIKDLIEEKVKEEEVVKIVANTRMANEHDFATVVVNYAKWYWYADPVKAVAIARKLWDAGKIEQPRLKTPDMYYASELVEKGLWETIL
jgi:hypothetical protein